MNNLFHNLPDSTSDEVTEILTTGEDVRIERIVSSGQATPLGEWYDQSQHEWVLVLQGEAELTFEDPAEVRPMGPGDYVNIPAHRRHRVESTANPTIWLAVFYS